MLWDGPSSVSDAFAWLDESILREIREKHPRNLAFLLQRAVERLEEGRCKL